MSETELTVCHFALTLFGLLLKRGWEPSDAETVIREAFTEAFPGTTFDAIMRYEADSSGPKGR
jgi:hypothetical protein